MATAPVLYLAFELGWTSWKLAFTIGAGQKPRLRSLPARDLYTLMLEIRKAQSRLGRPEETPAISCYEAGRDGFWLHRYLKHQGIENLVVDAASIEGTETGTQLSFPVSSLGGGLPSGDLFRPLICRPIGRSEPVRLTDSMAGGYNRELTAVRGSRR